MGASPSPGKRSLDFGAELTVFPYCRHPSPAPVRTRTAVAASYGTLLHLILVSGWYDKK